MKRNAIPRVAAALLAVCLLPLGQVRADENQAAAVPNRLSIYERPNRLSAIRAVADSGEMLEILGEEAEWYQVSFFTATGGGTGYVQKRFVVRDPQSVWAESRILVYSMPNTLSKAVEELEAGRQLLVLGEWGDFWAVSLSGASGFVLKREVRYSGDAAQQFTPPPTNLTPQPTRTVAPHPMPTVHPAPPVAPPIGTLEYQLVRDSSLYDAPELTANATGVMSAGSIVTLRRIRGGFGQESNSGYWIPMDNLALYYEDAPQREPR